MKVSIRKAARFLGVSPDTLRRWEAAGKIRVERTSGGHRRYDLGKLKGVEPRPLSEQPTVVYAGEMDQPRKDANILAWKSFGNSFHDNM